MKYYEKLLGMGIFSFADLIKLTGNKDTANSLVREYQKKQYIIRIKRNLYTAVNLETKEAVAGKFEIGSNVTDTAYVSHHSAFEYHGVMNQVYYEVYVSSESKFNNFEFKGIEYIYHQSIFNEGVIHSKNNRNIRVTDLERTVLDSIKDFEKIGGLEELLQCINLITYLDYEKLEKYLQCYNSQIMYQKTGYILEHFKDALKIPGKFFTMCESKIGKSRRYLYKDIKDEKNIYNGKWQLIVPENLLSIISSGGNVLV
jgi:predicted transcriptional regulator of viral defense system